MPSEALYNSRVIDTYLKLVMVKYPHVDIRALLRKVEIESYEVADQGKWFTQEQINRFFQAMVRATGNENVAREAGRYAASPGVLGTLRQSALAMLGPEKAFRLIGGLAKNLTRSATYSTERINSHGVEVTVTPLPGVREELFQCHNRIGFFEAMVNLFQDRIPQIEHPECLFSGGQVCRYQIRWRPGGTATLKKVRDIFIIAAATVNFALMFHDPLLTVAAVLPGSGLIFLALSWWLENNRRIQVEATLDQLRDSSEELTEQIGINYRNTQLTRQVGEAIASQHNIDSVLVAVVEILEKTLDYDRGLVLLANESTKRLEIRSAFGYSEEHLEILRRTSFRLDNPASQGPFVLSHRQKKPLMIDDVNEIAGQLTEKSRAFINALGIRSFLTVPIILEDKSIGILAVDNRRRKRPLLSSDLNLLMGIAPTIGMSIHNAYLNEARVNQFAATLRVLAQSIDARDYLTAGHSEEVAGYATAIAAELGEGYEFCQMIRLAALLHDYGKIGIPDTVLKKDGPLSDSERAMIETHSLKSKEILEQVPFEGIYQEIPRIALYHHERWDGNGYPERLAGSAIPYGARIVAVADFFEAITSKRHYREPMPQNVAIGLLQEGRGKHFDPRVVDAFLAVLLRTGEQDKSAHGDGEAIPADQRQTRYAYQSRARLTVDGRSLEGVTMDISHGGAYIQTPAAAEFERNATVRLQLSLAGHDSLALTGQVRWVNQNHCLASRRHPAGIGVAFTELDARARTVLKNTIRTLREDGASILEPPAVTALCQGNSR
ncbi:MAG: HD domain-containing protein [Desulfuromonadales bacterium]|nr:HD domain-containing protein [Desulfuromonadales bacterium]